MHVGQIHAAGPLDPVIARRVVKAAHARLEHCYEQALVGDPHLAGAVQGQLTIAADGATTQARFTGVDAGLDACLEEIARSLVFPAQSAETHVDLPIDVSRP